ncbi:hypothetical protein PRIPAC_89912 [Pristionchus pacificus]|uniref:Uncharacterized protein n=1 Tax=Pristionchus pacificus TaxID=54126 RepID=A0A2A6B7S1_PRIPA|nr:hypothetical protein PRIPAC_89912 [Pristionchus pacificus]|eukprot:PDM61914.1 hypothetical protein PRIPAC_51356 [Pristionchus pacificus]
MCNGRPSRTPSPDTEGNQSSHLATTAPTLRPSPPRPLPARLRCRSVQRGQGRPITEQLRTSTRTPDRSPNPRHDRDLRICTLNCRTLASDASIAALEQSFEGIRYDVVCLQETKASKTQELTLTNGARLILGPKVEKKNIGGVGFLIHPRLVSSILSFSILSPRLAKAKQSLSRSKAPMDAILDSSGAPITSRTGIEERVAVSSTCPFSSISNTVGPLAALCRRLSVPFVLTPSNC